LDSKMKDKWFCTEWQHAFPDFNLLLISSWREMIWLFPNMWTLPPVQRCYSQSLYCDFGLHSVLETLPCT
jgi:hypothetical protein